MLPVIRRNGLPVATTGGFDQLRNEMDTLFDRFFGQDGSSLTPWAGVPMAVWEDEDHVYVEAELPGMTESDIDVTVHQGMLYLRGQRRGPEDRRFLFNNRAYGQFQRAFTLPAVVDSERIEAQLDRGLLRLTLPKSAEAKPRRIALKSREAQATE